MSMKNYTREDILNLVEEDTVARIAAAETAAQ